MARAKGTVGKEQNVFCANISNVSLASFPHPLPSTDPPSMLGACFAAWFPTQYSRYKWWRFCLPSPSLSHYPFNMYNHYVPLFSQTDYSVVMLFLPLPSFSYIILSPLSAWTVLSWSVFNAISDLPCAFHPFSFRSFLLPSLFHYFSHFTNSELRCVVGLYSNVYSYSIYR